MSTILFFIAGFGAIAGAVGVVVLRDPFYSVLALVGHLISLAVLFLLLRAEFVAAAQVVVYAGAVMVLYVFVVAYVGGSGADSLGDEPLARPARSSASNLRLGGAIAGGALLIELLIALLGTGLKAIGGYGAAYAPGPRTFGTPAYIGNLLLTRFLLAFEAASFLLLIAAVGAVVLAGRRGGLEDEDEQTAHAARPDPPAGHRHDGRGRRRPAAMSIAWYLAVSAIVFSLGVVGVITRRNPLVVLLCLELMLNGANLSLVAFARMWGNGDGQILALIVMTVAACEVCIGLGMIVAIYRRRLPVDVDELRELQGLDERDHLRLAGAACSRCSGRS